MIKGDKRMQELKDKLLEDCNSSGLPLEAILFVTKDLYRDVEATLIQFKEQQAAAAAQEEK